MDEEIDDGIGRALWAAAGQRQAGGRPRAAGCPEAMALAAYIDRRAPPSTVETVEAQLADCRETACLCLAALAAARQPAIEPVSPAALALARALVAASPAQRVWRAAQWIAAAAMVVFAAGLGFDLGVSTAGYREHLVQVEDTTATAGWVDLGVASDL